MASKLESVATRVLKIFSLVLILGIFTHFASAESGISLTQENATQTIDGVEYLIGQKVTLTVDELIEITYTCSIDPGAAYAAAPNVPDAATGDNPVFFSYLPLDFHFDTSLSGDIAIQYGLTTDRSQIFNTNDRRLQLGYTKNAEYASESWTNGNPNTIWYKDESVTKRYNRFYLFYIGETYAAWIELGFVIQPNYSLFFSVEDHEIVPVENRQSMRLPGIPQVDDAENQIGINLKGAGTVEGTAHKQGTYVVLSSADLKNWDSVSSFSLNHPGSIKFSVSLPTQNTYEVWEIPSEDTSHPNYDEESGIIWLDEPLLESTPIRSRFFKIEYQAPE